MDCSELVRVRADDPTINDRRKNLMPLRYSEVARDFAASDLLKSYSYEIKDSAEE